MVSFSVITPSLNMADMLQRCHASIMDQGVDVCHIVADPGSTDGTREWLADRSDVEAIFEEDSGMYDAINRGISMADGDIVSYLNCDEQYLPGTLKHVAEIFESNPAIHLVFGDLILVDPEGKPLAYRKGHQPRWLYIGIAHLYVMSCTMFVRRIVFDKGFRFSPNFKAAGDADLVIRMLKAGFKAMHVSRYFSTFTITESNLGASHYAVREARELFMTMPTWARMLRFPINMLRFTEKVLAGAYYQPAPLEYDIYTGADLYQRKAISFRKPSWRWPG